MDNKQLSDLHALWNDVQKEKRRVSARSRRARLINPAVYFVFYGLTAVYILYKFCDLLIERNAKPDWLPFDGLVRFVNDLFSFSGGLTAFLLLCTIPVVLGIVMKLLIHFPDKSAEAALPETLYDLRKGIHDGIVKIEEIKKAIHTTSWGFGIPFILVAAFAVIFGIQSQLWGKALLSFLLVSATIVGGYFAIFLFGFEHGGFVEPFEQRKVDANKREYEILSILHQCTDLIRENKYGEALASLKEYSYERDLSLLATMLNGIDDFCYAAKALDDLRRHHKYDHDEMKAIVAMLKPTLERNAEAYCVDSEKKADQLIAEGKFAKACDALEYIYTADADKMVKYAYARLKCDPKMSIESLKKISSLLNTAEKGGYSDAVETMYQDALSMLYAYAKKYADMDIPVQDNYGDPVDIHEARAQLRSQIASSRLSLEEKQSLVQAHNAKYIDSVEIVNGTYYNIYE